MLDTIHKGDLANATIVRVYDPLAMPHPTHIGAFSHITVGKAGDPMTMPLVVHNGAFFNPAIGKPLDPIAMLFAPHIGAFPYIAIGITDDPIPEFKLPDADGKTRGKTVKNLRATDQIVPTGLQLLFHFKPSDGNH